MVLHNSTEIPSLARGDLHLQALAQQPLVSDHRRPLGTDLASSTDLRVKVLSLIGVLLFCAAFFGFAASIIAYSRIGLTRRPHRTKGDVKRSLEDGSLTVAPTLNYSSDDSEDEMTRAKALALRNF